VKILLLQPPLEDFYTTPIRQYPLGLTYVAAVLQKIGHEVIILDALNPLTKRTLAIPPFFRYLEALFRDNPYLFRHYYRFGLQDEEIIARIRAQAPELVGISSNFTAYFKNVSELAALIATELQIPVFIGGHHATAFAAEIRERAPQIAHILTGPAEFCIPRFFCDPAAPPLPWQELMPAHHLLQAVAYRIGSSCYASLVASQGCAFSCDFCSVHLMTGSPMRFRSVQHILDEMRQLHQQGVTLFNFEDDNLSFQRSWFMELLDAIAAEPWHGAIELTAMNGLCAATLDEEILVHMRQAGFKQLNLSLVTQNEQLRSLYNRPNRGVELDTLVQFALRCGFFVTVYLILGLPGQNAEEIQQTIDYLFSLQVLVAPSVFYLPPGSSLYNRMLIAPEIKNEWNLYRSSAFAIETDLLQRRQLIAFFSQIRKRNLEQKQVMPQEKEGCHER
jgi:radical SAM superfamily enzyme YgiQ (UPF0313 family)